VLLFELDQEAKDDAREVSRTVVADVGKAASGKTTARGCVVIRGGERLDSVWVAGDAVVLSLEK
jgi:hypothetical protein